MVATTPTAVTDVADVTGDAEADAGLQHAYNELLAALGGEPVTLDTLVSDLCQVIGPKGFLIRKGEWIDAHNGEVYEQLRLDSIEHDAQIYGDTAIRWDLQRSECLFQGEKITGLFRVLSAWHRQHARWQLVAIQYTAVSPEAGAGSRTAP
jgi:hypothetical protein